MDNNYKKLYVVDYIGMNDHFDATKALAKKIANRDQANSISLKEACQIAYNKQDVSKKLKVLARYTRKPAGVVIVCPEFNDTVKWNADCWLDVDIKTGEKRLDKVYVIETGGTNPHLSVYEPEYRQYYQDYEVHGNIHKIHLKDAAGNVHTRSIVQVDKTRSGERLSEARETALIWADAIGYEFSAPLVRDPRNEAPDLYQKRTRVRNFGIGATRWDKVDKDGNVRHVYYDDGCYTSAEDLALKDVKLSKITSSAEGFITYAREIATEAECEKFFEYFELLRDNYNLAEFLAEGYAICPICGHPIRIASIERNYTDAVECAHCESWIGLNEYNRPIEVEPTSFTKMDAGQRMKADEYAFDRVCNGDYADDENYFEEE